MRVCLVEVAWKSEIEGTQTWHQSYCAGNSDTEIGFPVSQCEADFAFVVLGTTRVKKPKA